MVDLLTALCLVMVIEGILPFLAPASWKRAMAEAIKLSDSSLRSFGLIMMIVGVALLMWIRN